MKVVFDGRTIRPRRTGVGRYSERLLRALMAVDLANEYVVLLNDESIWRQWDVSANFRAQAVRADYESHPGGDLWLRFGLPRLLKRERADLFHGPAFQVPPRRAWRPTIVTIHDLTCRLCPRDYPWRFRHYMRWVIRRSCAAAAAVVVPSCATADELGRLVGVREPKIHVIYEAADERFQPAPSPDRHRLAAIHPALEKPYILTVGTIEPRKRIDLLVAAYERLRRHSSLSHSLIVAGKVGWKASSSLRALANSTAAQSIHHLDYVGEDDLVALYQGADLFVCTSRYEGFGLPPLEAMACGVPVVVTAGGALAEVVGDGGVVIKNESAEALADTIAAILSVDMRRRMLGEKARRRAAQFSWETTAKQTLALYQETARV